MNFRFSKYANRRTSVGQLSFMSAREARRWQELQIRERAGEISNLQRQVRFDLHAHSVSASKEKVCLYVADFVYLRHGQRIVEDCKGFRTPIYKIKRKWMRAEYGISILET
jgi:hypothetical protein